MSKFVKLINVGFLEQSQYQDINSYFFLTVIIRITLLYLLWNALYVYGVVEGVTYTSKEALLSYIVLAAIVSIFISTRIFYNFTNLIITGDILKEYVLPISVSLKVLSIDIGQTRIYNSLVTLLAILYAILCLNLIYPPTLFALILFIISSFLAYLLLAAVDLIFALSVLKTTNAWGIAQIKISIVKLLSGSLVPLPLFPDVIERIIKLLPFSSMVYTPVMIYLNGLTTETAKLLALQLFWVVVLLVVTYYYVEKLMVTKLESIGG